MKTTTILVAIFLSLGIATSSCASKSSENKEETPSEQSTGKQYRCPMECEGSKTYSAPGDCPVCEMEMEEVSEI